MDTKNLIQTVLAIMIIVVGLGMLFPLIWHKRIRATCTWCEKNEHPYLKTGRVWHRRAVSGFQSDFEYYKDGEYHTAKQHALYDAKHTPGKEYTVFISKSNSVMTLSEVVRDVMVIIIGIIALFI